MGTDGRARADARSSFPIDRSSERLCVVLVCGSMRTHDRDWAGLCVDARSDRSIRVKPLEVNARNEADSIATLRVATEWPMKRVDVSACMERLTFTADGIGSVAGVVKRPDGADDVPMLRERFRVEVTEAERAMVGGESPERFRAAGAGAASPSFRYDVGGDDDEDANRVSESVYSLFEVRRDGDSDSIDESPPADTTDIQEESPRIQVETPHDRRTEFVEGAGDSLSPVCGPDVRELLRSSASDKEVSASQASEDVAGAFHAATSPNVGEWVGAVSYLREQLAAQRGVRLVFRRADVQRLLEEIEKDDG